MASKQDYMEANLRFLDENAKAPGVKTLPSGVQYKVKVKGTGRIPVSDSVVQVYYRGKLINGKEVDSNFGEPVPATFRLRELIMGWQQALRAMPVGSRWEIYIPYNLGYGSRQAGMIKPYSTLIFEVELTGIA